MKRLLIILATTALAASTVHAQSTAEKEVLALSATRMRWQLEGKIDSIATTFDDQLVVVHANGMVRTGAEHLADLRAGRPVYKSIDVTSATAHVTDATAVLVGSGHFVITMNGADREYDLAYMEVYAKRHGRWLMVGWQVSSVPKR